jgi:branched-chain amino acid transport system ATP-binding protein
VCGKAGKSLSYSLVEHDMDVVFQLAERVTAVVNGSVLAARSPEEVRRGPKVSQVYPGHDD